MMRTEAQLTVGFSEVKVTLVFLTSGEQDPPLTFQLQRVSEPPRHGAPRAEGSAGADVAAWRLRLAHGPVCTGLLRRLRQQSQSPYQPTH